jgi:ATP/maltotriose-dependent transcriptional regulator MalT
MRVIVVGPPDARARLVAHLPQGIEIVGEARTLREARQRWTDADACLVAPSEGTTFGADEGQGEFASVEPLTTREVAVLELLAQGLPNKSIAARLGISDHTVKFHVTSICGKLGASNRTDAARRALRLGMIPL